MQRDTNKCSTESLLLDITFLFNYTSITSKNRVSLKSEKRIDALDVPEFLQVLRLIDFVGKEVQDMDFYRVSIIQIL